MLHARTPTLHAPREMGGGGPARPLLKSSGRLRPCWAKVACTSLPASCAWTWQCLCVSRRTTHGVAARIPAGHRRPAPPCLQHDWAWQCFCSTKLHRAWWQPRPAPPALQLLVRLAPGGARVVCRVGQIHMWQAQATVIPVELTVYTAQIPYEHSKNTDVANPTGVARRAVGGQGSSASSSPCPLCTGGQETPAHRSALSTDGHETPAHRSALSTGGQGMPAHCPALSRGRLPARKKPQGPTSQEHVVQPDHGVLRVAAAGVLDECNAARLLGEVVLQRGGAGGGACSGAEGRRVGGGTAAQQGGVGCPAVKGQAELAGAAPGPWVSARPRAMR